MHTKYRYGDNSYRYGVESQQESNALKNDSVGLPWWPSGKESTWQCGRHEFDPWSGKIAQKPCATTTESAMLCFRARAAQQDEPLPREAREQQLESRRWAPARKRETGPRSNQDPAQPSMQVKLLKINNNAVTGAWIMGTYRKQTGHGERGG